MKTNTNNEFKKGLVIDGIKPVGNGLGIYATQPAIRSTLERNMRLVDGVMRIAFSSTPAVSSKSERIIELAGLGAIAAYTILRGVERKNKSLLIQGVFLGTALVAVSLASAKRAWKTKKRSVN